MKEIEISGESWLHPDSSTEGGGGVLSPPTLGGGKREDLLQDDDDVDLYARTTTIIESDPHITAREVP